MPPDNGSYVVGSAAQALAEASASGAPYTLYTQRLYSMESEEMLEGFMAVADGRVVGMGEGPLPEYFALERHFDLGDVPVMPGFVDPHIHLEQAAVSNYGAVDCNVEVAPSIDAMLDGLVQNRSYAEQRGGWLIGQGNLFYDRRVDERRFPLRADLDKVSQTIPIVLRCGSHVSVLNSAALTRLEERAPSMRGDAAIERDGAGRPNGIIHELYHELGIPDLDQHEMLDAIMTTARRQLTDNGVTTIGEITNSVASLEALSGLVADGRIQQRVRAYPCVPWTVSSVEEAIRVAARTDISSERMQVDAIKIFVDGGFSAAGAAVLRPYRTGAIDAPLGRLAYTEQELYALIQSLNDRGLNLVAHTNGERAQRVLCTAAAQLPDRNVSIRLEHAGNFLSDPATVNYWQEADAFIVAQASFIWIMAPFLPEYLGDYAQIGRMPFRRLSSAGVPMAFASDATGSEPRAFDPMFNVGCAMTRVGCTGEIIEADEQLDVFTALSLHTREAAKAMNMSGEVGTLAPGTYADFILLSGSPTRESIIRGDVTVTHTFIGGRYAQ